MNRLKEKEIEPLVNALLSRLYTSRKESLDDSKLIWSNFVKKYPVLASRICHSLAELWTKLWKPVFALRLGINAEPIFTEKTANQQFIHLLDSFWQDFFPKNISYEELDRLRNEIDHLVKNSLKTVDLVNPTLTTNTQSLPSTAQWQYHPLPENEPDRHQESYCRAMDSPEGFQLIGARVRGKKHKHDGTNCDDWFDFTVSGTWTIIAVADGAGSKKFSRVGAKASCRAAVKDLANSLKGHKIKQRDLWSVETFQRDEETGAFAEEDLEYVQTALHQSMQVAYKAVEKAKCDRLPYTAYYKSLNHRDLELDDLAATLLLAVHTIVPYKDTNYSLILTCQIGDGMTTAVDREGKIQLLGVPDSGEFAGQTEFLTTQGKLERDNLMRKTFPFFRPLQTLMVMTDGVADDYFPPDPGMLQLYGDLLLNRIIDFPKPHNGEIVDKLSNTNLGSLPGVEEAKDKFQEVVQRLTDPEDQLQKVPIYSLGAYAQELGVPLPQVVTSPALLAAGFGSELMENNCPCQSSEEQLRLWLDSYQIKGSFDDRTLVVLFNKATGECRGEGPLGM